MMRGEKTVLVLTDLTINPPDGSQHDLTSTTCSTWTRASPRPRSSAIPGLPERKGPGPRRLARTTAPSSCGCAGVSKNPADEFHAATVESLSLDVTHKPLIALVWGGFYVMMAGGLLAFIKRSREARQAVLEASQAAEQVRPDPPVAVTGPALPAHTRSPL